MAHPIETKLNDLIDTFAFLGDWEERYRHVIELGKALPPLEEAYRSEAYRVLGCASQVWLVAEAKEGRLILRGDSDAHIVRGLVALVLDLYSDATAQDILSFDAKAGFARLGLAEALSTQRANGLASMVERIRALARSL